MLEISPCEHLLVRAIAASILCPYLLCLKVIFFCVVCVMCRMKGSRYFASALSLLFIEWLTVFV